MDTAQSLIRNFKSQPRLLLEDARDTGMRASMGLEQGFLVTPRAHPTTAAVPEISTTTRNGVADRASDPISILHSQRPVHLSLVRKSALRNVRWSPGPLSQVEVASKWSG